MLGLAILGLYQIVDIKTTLIIGSKNKCEFDFQLNFNTKQIICFIYSIKKFQNMIFFVKDFFLIFWKNEPIETNPLLRATNHVQNESDSEI